VKLKIKVINLLDMENKVDLAQVSLVCLMVIFIIAVLV
jgi:hypothetical protein